MGKKPNYLLSQRLTMFCCEVNFMQAQGRKEQKLKQGSNSFKLALFCANVFYSLEKLEAEPAINNKSIKSGL